MFRLFSLSGPILSKHYPFLLQIMNKPSLNGSVKNLPETEFLISKIQKIISEIILISIRANILTVIIITLGFIILTIIYVLYAKDIYKSSATIKINRPQGSVLSSSLIPEFQDFITDRYISNEIEVLKS